MLRAVFEAVARPSLPRDIYPSKCGRPWEVIVFASKIFTRAITPINTNALPEALLSFILSVSNFLSIDIEFLLAEEFPFQPVLT